MRGRLTGRSHCAWHAYYTIASRFCSDRSCFCRRVDVRTRGKAQNFTAYGVEPRWCSPLGGQSKEITTAWQMPTSAYRYHHHRHRRCITCPASDCRCWTYNHCAKSSWRPVCRTSDLTLFCCLLRSTGAAVAAAFSSAVLCPPLHRPAFSSLVSSVPRLLYTTALLPLPPPPPPRCAKNAVARHENLTPCDARRAPLLANVTDGDNDEKA